MTYRLLVTMLILSAVPPAILVVVGGKPRHIRDFWNRPDLGIAGAFAIDGSRRVYLLLSGIVYPYPGHIVGTFTYLSLGVTSLALWAKAVQIIRHHQRNKETLRRGQLWLLEHYQPTKAGEEDL